MDFKEYSDGAFDTEEQKKFRKEVRDWLDKNIPPELAKSDEEEISTTRMQKGREFARKLGAKGWLAPEWPKEYGGAGLSPELRHIIAQEVAARNVPLPAHTGNFQGGIAGPAVMRFGTEEQKKEWGPRIAAGAVFSLGYTEPNAGTDLASLQMRAVSDGDDYIVNGQKIFSGGVHTADYHWLLVRTNPNVPKHRGISLLMADLHSPGLTIKPLTLISGARTNEIFYDNVRVPKKNRVGTENEGWGITRTALTTERASLGTAPWGRLALDDLIKYVKETKRNGKLLSEDPFVRQSLAQCFMEVDILRLFNLRVGWMVDSGQSPEWTGAATKIWEAESSQRIANIGMQILGLACQLEPGSKWVPLKGRIEVGYRETVVRSFGGGSDELMRSLMATRGMGLPREPTLIMKK